jgi:hypothetical protein
LLSVHIRGVVSHTVKKEGENTNRATERGQRRGEAAGIESERRSWTQTQCTRAAARDSNRETTYRRTEEE